MHLLCVCSFHTVPPFVFVVIGGASVGEKYGLSDNKQLYVLSRTCAHFTHMHAWSSRAHYIIHCNNICIIKL